jgi:hypothetical protein
MNTDSSHQAEEIRAELQDTPFLQQLPKQGFFEAPDGYFEKLSERLQTNIEETAAFAEEAPTLSDLPKEPFFSAPEGYFQQLPSRLRQTIESAELAPAIRRPLWRRPAVMLGMAAALTCLLLFRFWQEPSAQAERDWSEIPTRELLAMVETEAIPTELLLDVLGEESLNAFGDLKAEDISEEELSEYLENIDLEELEANWLE